MNMHFCTENPCPIQDKECYDRLNAGFTTENLLGKIMVEFDEKEVKKWIGSKGTC